MDDIILHVRSRCNGKVSNICVWFYEYTKSIAGLTKTAIAYGIKIALPKPDSIPLPPKFAV